MNPRWLGAVLLGTALAAGGCGGGTSVEDEALEDQAIVAALTRQADAWDRAIVARDRDAVANNMAEDFRIIDGLGNVDDKQKFLADILDPKLRIDPYTVEDFEVRLYGDTALLSGRTHMTGAFDGQPFESNYRYIDIYVRRDGAWKIVSVQITRFPAPAAAKPEA
jgi:ketosteroid isomerase-like protein